MKQTDIKGYRQLDAGTVEQINAIKENANELGSLLDYFAGQPDVDQRWLAIARTDLQKGFMFLIRALARPEGF